MSGGGFADLAMVAAIIGVIVLLLASIVGVGYFLWNESYVWASFFAAPLIFLFFLFIRNVFR